MRVEPVVGHDDAMDEGARLLAARPRTEAEMRARLAAAGFPRDAVDSAAGRMLDLGLLDDRAFAARWVEERAVRRGLSSRALVAELEAKGVDRSVAEDAVAGVGGDDLARAGEVAAATMSRLAGLPLATQARRLAGALGRRGYDPDVVAEAVRAVLPPEGWD